MGLGFGTAWGEVTLVLFTTLAPSGTLAYVLMTASILLGRVDGDGRARIEKFLSIPLVLTLGGLVASATHLGNPSNALYVLSRVGASPLSNEVLAAVAFLAFAGLYWLYSFSRAPHRALQRVWIVATALAGAAFVASMARAYAVQTVPTWDSPLVPAALCLNAFVGGPVLAGLGWYAAGHARPGDAASRALAATSLVALAANVAVYALQAAELGGQANGIVRATDLVPHFGAMVAAFALLCLAGVTVFAGVGRARGQVRKGAGATAKGAGTGTGAVVRGAAGCALVLAGVFVMRFAFYMAHMTVGLGF